MNLLITGAWREARSHILGLYNKYSVSFLDDETDALPCDPSWVEGIIGNGIFLSHPIECFTALKYIQLTSAGFDRVPMDYVVEHDIKINNARGVYSFPMAEAAIAGVLSIHRKMRKFSKNQEAHLWEKQRDLREIAGKNVTIIGCGSVGNACAKRFNAFEASVTGVDIVVRQDDLFGTIYGMDKLDETIRNSDIVVLTVPLTSETEGLFDKDRLAILKNDTVLVNISRGAVVDTDALIAEVKSRRLSAVLDVFEEEPLGVASPLWNLDNVILTPHNSFVGDGNEKRLSTIILKNLEAYEAEGKIE